MRGIKLGKGNLVKVIVGAIAAIIVIVLCLGVTAMARERMAREERQRAYLAMAIAQDTPMLLLDEPGAHLDVSHRLEAARIMRQLANEGRGVVVTSHDLPEAFSGCDDICIVNHATIVAQGTVDSIAADEALLRDAMGVCVRRVEGEDLVHHYSLSY